MRLKGKVAIVTGAGRGIGRAIAIGYASEGAAVVVNYSRSSDAADEAVNSIRSKGGNAIAVRADVSSVADLDCLLATTINTFGKLDILVNNAGIEFNESVLEPTETAWDQTIGVNLKGAYFLSCKAAQIMSKAGHGKIINISSMHDMQPVRDRAIYSASKGGMLMMMKSLALELAQFNIHVNSISPGAIFTDMNRKHLTDPPRRARLVERIPLKRIGDVEDVVGAAVFLASSESDYVTGTTIYVDGGLTLV